MTTRETSFRESDHPGIVFPGNVLSGENDHPGNDFPGNVFPGKKPSGKVTIRQTTVNLMKHDNKEIQQIDKETGTNTNRSQI